MIRFFLLASIVFLPQSFAGTSIPKPYTDARARSAISASAPISYNSSTGVISCVAATGLVDGCLSAAKWLEFDSKQPAGDYATSGSGDVSWSAHAGAGPVTTTIGANKVLSSMIGSGSATSGYVLTADGSGGTSWLAQSGGGGSGITSLNGLTGATQTFATPGTSGTAPNWSSSGTAHTLNIPMAATSSVTAGLISKTQYDTFAAKQDAIANTDSLAEGSTNLYWTNSRFDTRFSAKTTSDLSEGSNLYFTNGRAIAATLTGFSSGGTMPVAATDTVLQGFQKLNYAVVNFNAAVDGGSASSVYTAAQVIDGGTP